MQCAGNVHALKSRIKIGSLHVDVLLLFPQKIHQTFLSANLLEHQYP